MKYLKYIRVQIALLYLLISLVVLSVFGLVVYFSVESIFLNQSLVTSEQTINTGGKYLELYVDRLASYSKLIATNSNTRNYLEYNLEEKQTEQLITNVLAADEYITTVIVVSKDGRVLSNEKAINMTVSDDMMNEHWYVEAMSSDSISLTGAKMTAFSMDKSNWVISSATQVIDGFGNHLGVVIIDFSYQGIEDLLNQISLGSEGYTFIINSKNQIVYHPDSAFYTEQEKANEVIEMTLMNEGYHKEMNKSSHQVSIKGSDWKLIGVVSLDELNLFRNQLLDTLLFTFILMIIVIVASGAYFGIVITKPIKELEGAMAEFDQKSPKFVNVDVKMVEIKSLAQHYNQMVKRVLSLMDEIEKNQKYLRTYEIKALHSQINPHFLYNTLDTIIWMAEFEETDSVIEITKSLASFFRLSLSKGRDVVRLKDELNHVKEYLSIQKQRYSDKLDYVINVNEEVNNYQVPKIILQPIVENAIYYGIKEQTDLGTVKIEVFNKDKFILIEISDNGRGITADKLIEINEKLKYGTLSYIESDGSGIGITNVAKRLKLFYDHEDLLRIDSEFNKGTKVTIKIPKSDQLV